MDTLRLVLGLEGDLSVMSVPDVVIWLANRKKTGILFLTRGGEEKSVTIERGKAIAASTNDPREYLGQFLVNFGLVTEDQLQRAFEAQRETKVLLGRILVMIGTCTEEQVKRTLDRQIREVMHSALPWKEGSFRFEPLESVERGEGDLGVAVPLIEIHREGALRVQHWEEIRSIFPVDDMVLTVREAKVPANTRPETFDGRILALARAGLTIEGIKLDLHSTDFHFYARLVDLHRRGAIEARETGPIHPIGYNEPLKEGPHGELAAQALAQGDYRKAMEHAREGIKAEPANKALAELLNSAERGAKADGPSPEAVPNLSAPLEELLGQRLSARERYILTRVDGTRNIQSIIQISPMREAEGMEIFRRLSQAGLVSY